MYNEPDLKSQPVWPLIETGLEAQFKKIKANWKSIRDEALNVYSASSGGFINESESLKDTGYWGQFDLFIHNGVTQKDTALHFNLCSQNVVIMKSV